MHTGKLDAPTLVELANDLDTGTPFLDSPAL
jgi:hypothetical protein